MRETYVGPLRISMARPCYVGHVRGSASLARPAKKVGLVPTRLQQTSQRDRLVAPMASSVVPIYGEARGSEASGTAIFIIDTTWLRKEKWYAHENPNHCSSGLYVK